MLLYTHKKAVNCYRTKVKPKLKPYWQDLYKNDSHVILALT